jgi:ribosomal protein S2
MRYLNKTFLLKRGILLGEKSYTYRTKSLLFKKLYSNFIFDSNQSSFYLKKALKIVSDIIRIRGTILIYSRNLSINDFNLINISKINSRIIFISHKWVPGTINNFLTRSQLKIELIPDLVIVLNKSIIENTIVLGEASCLSIPCILLISSFFKFDLLSYPI